jgi:hypothetical protein
MKVSLNKEKWARIKDAMLREMQAPDSTFIKSVFDTVSGKIISRTKSGIDVGGMKFTPYSKAYAKKKGRGSPDLTLTGQMLSKGAFKFQTFYQDGRVIIRIWMEGPHTGGIDIGTLASVHNFGGKSGRGDGFSMTKREFFGIDEAITKALKDLKTEQWQKIIRSFG